MFKVAASLIACRLDAIPVTHLCLGGRSTIRQVEETTVRTGAISVRHARAPSDDSMRWRLEWLLRSTSDDY